MRRAARQPPFHLWHAGLEGVDTSSRSARPARCRFRRRTIRSCMLPD